MSRYRFGAAAIALALALWSHEGRSARKVRGGVSPARIVGACAARNWASLVRWTERAYAMWPWLDLPPPEWSPRRRAERISSALATHALSSIGSLTERAFEGAGRAPSF